MSSTIGQTSGKWSKIKGGKRWEASYRVDWRQSLEGNTSFVPVIHHRCEQQAEQQTMLIPCSTRELAAAAAAAAERILAQLGYRREEST